MLYLFNTPVEIHKVNIRQENHNRVFTSFSSYHNSRIFIKVAFVTPTTESRFEEIHLTIARDDEIAGNLYKTCFDLNIFIPLLLRVYII